MADILIKGLELPTEERISLSIYPNGIVVNHSTLKVEKNRTKAIELPPHGDLIDRQTVLSYFKTGYLMVADMDYEDVVAIVSNEKAIPTILEANNG